jgi:hypothetical protein
MIRTIVSANYRHHCCATVMRWLYYHGTQSQALWQRRLMERCGSVVQRSLHAPVSLCRASCRGWRVMPRGLRVLHLKRSTEQRQLKSSMRRAPSGKDNVRVVKTFGKEGRLKHRTPERRITSYQTVQENIELPRTSQWQLGNIAVDRGAKHLHLLKTAICIMEGWTAVRTRRGTPHTSSNDGRHGQQQILGFHGMDVHVSMSRNCD